jgi:hypothetical protein
LPELMQGFASKKVLVLDLHDLLDDSGFRD